MNEDLRHRVTSRRSGRPWRYLVASVTLVAIGMALGSVVSRPSTAWSESRKPATPQHFKSGSELALPVLQDMAATLRQIDARLARLEAAAQQWQRQNP